MKLKGKLTLLAKKYGPKVMMGLGFLAIGGGIVYACNSSRHIDEKLDALEDKISDHRANLTGVECDKAVRKEKLIFAGEMAKDFGPAALLIVGGGVLIGKSFNDIEKDLKATALNLAEQGALFGAYRGLVKTELGEDADRHFMYGTEPYTIEKPAYTNADGYEVPAETKVYSDTVDSSDIDFGLIFDERSSYFNRDNESDNDTTLRQAEEDLRRQLIGDGYLFCDRIKTRLGFSSKYITAADKTHGFLYIPGKDPSGDYDANANNVFSLGIYNAHDRNLRLNGDLGTSYLLYPTSYGCGPVRIVDLFEKAKKQ